MAGNNFTNQWNNQALQAKRLENVLGWDYPSQTQQIIATDVTVPYNVNWNTPSYGNQFCGGIKIEKTIDNEYLNLKVTLAGASSPTTFLVKTGDFLDVQATSISSENVDLEVTRIVVYMGQASEQPLEPFYNNLFQPYYNFDVVADWKALTGVTPFTQTDFEDWLTSGGLNFLAPTVLEGYIFEPIIDDPIGGIQIGRIKCRLEVDCKGNGWQLNNNFFEINGLGDFKDCLGIYIDSNNQVLDYPQLNVFLRGLKEVNFKYYSQLDSKIQTFQANGNNYLENFDLSFLQFCTTGSFKNFTIQYNTLIEEFSNFVLMPNSTLSFNMDGMYGFRRFEYNLTNTNITNFTFRNSGTFTPDGAQRLGLEYINTSLLPDTITNLVLTNNNLKVMTTGYTKFPSSLQSIELQNNEMVNFNPECSLPPLLNTLFLSSNLLYEFDLNYPLPNSLFFINLSSNLIQRYNTQCPQGLTSLDLNNNQLTKANFFNLLNPSLNSLNLASNAFAELIADGPFPTGLFILYLNNNSISRCLFQGPNGPANIFLYANEMTVDSWTEMNTWASGLTAAGAGTKQFYAFSNPGSISGTTTETTLISKGYNVF